MMDAASRDGYGAALLDLSENDKIVVLEADLGKAYKVLPLPSGNILNAHFQWALLNKT